MWFEVIRWVSIVLSWFALGLNVWGFVRSNRMFKMYRDKYLELLREKVRLSVAEDNLTKPEE